MKKIWFVTYGENVSHMWESKPCYKLKDAKKFIEELESNAYGNPRPWILEKYEYLESKIYGDIVNITEISRNTY